MTMAELSAIGLAGNIIQFVDFGARLLSKSREIYQSSTGHTAEHVELHDIATHLSRLSDDLIVPGIAQDVRRTQLETEICSLARSAQKVAADLQSVIDRLQTGAQQNSKWRSFRQALKTVWKKEKIAELSQRLDNLRNQLCTQVIAHISVSQKELLDLSKAQLQQIGSTNEAHRKQIEAITGTVQQIYEGQHVNDQVLKDIDEKLRYCQSRIADIPDESRVLRELAFEDMYHRSWAIVKAHPKTFEWIFNPKHFSSSDPRSKIRFTDWLTSGNGIYWISGKPGSGKSTLMKYLYQCDQTMDCLQTWASGGTIYTSAFYFWMPGTDLQKSTRGLFLHLLHELLSKVPSLIPKVLPDQWSHRAKRAFYLSPPEVISAFNKLKAELASSTVKLCLFIDGLDEYDDKSGDLGLSGLVSVLQDIASTGNIKICLSSRPWPRFEDAFGSIPERKLYLQDLTVDDIALFTKDRIKESPRFSSLLLQNPEAYPQLVSEIVSKAQGVFPWVFLVVKSLDDGLCNDDSIGLLRERLLELPSDLEEFFERIIRSVDHVYRRRMAETFQVALRTPRPLRLLSYLYLDPEELREARHSFDFHKLKLRMSRHLSGRYKGLLEHDQFGEVGFIHRTVFDFLQTKSMHEYLTAATDANFNPCAAACMAVCEKTKQFPSDLDCPEFEAFLALARYAEMETGHMDVQMIDDLRSALEKAQGHVLNPESVIEGIVQFGLTTYLKTKLTRPVSSLRRNNNVLLQAVLAIQQPKLAGELFGPHTLSETLSFLLAEGADPNCRTARSTVFHDFMIEQYGELPTLRQYAEPQLIVLLRHNANIDSLFITHMNWQERSWHYHMVGYLNNTNVVSYFEPLNYHRNFPTKLYGILMQHGLNPNRRLTWYTLWEMILWFVVMWQTDHGELEPLGVDLINTFLYYGADPYQTVKVISDRVPNPILTVDEIINFVFTEENRKRLRRSYEDAVRRWRWRRH